MIFSCIEEYIPPEMGKDSKSYLSVDGILFDNDSLKTIILSRSLPSFRVDTSISMVTNALVSVTDDLDRVTVFEENESGHYQASFIPEFDRSYRLKILDDSGNEFLSEEVTMIKTPGIDSIYWRMKNNLTSDVDGGDGIEILIAAHDAEEPINYMRWEWTETWEFRTPFHSFFDLQDGSVVYRDYVPLSCWKENNSNDILVANTDALSMNLFRDQVIHTVPFDQNKLYIRYSILVNQYAIDEKAYHFLSQMKKSNETTGNLFDPQPSEIRSNIIKVNDPEEPVLGYFDIYHEEHLRLFIERRDVPVKQIFSGYSNCEKDTASTAEIKDYVFAGYNILDVARSLYSPDTVGWVVTSRDCSDCRERGSAEKPLFW